MKATRRNQQVHIGIVTSPMPLKHLNRAASYLDKSYISWIEMSGANAVLIPYNTDMLPTYLSSVHGIVWTGGGIENIKTHSEVQYATLMQTLRDTYDHAVRENDRGNYYPLWGTCQGFDILAMMPENKKDGYFSRIQHANKFRLGPLVFQGPSRLREAIPKTLQKELIRSPVVQHIHEYGFDLKSPHTAKLRKYLKIVSVDQADNGVEFMNMFEFKKYPFYGCQWHPEKPLTDLGIDLSYTLSVFFRNECLHNTNFIPRWSKVSVAGTLNSKQSVLVKG